jgi:hypothetical protein
MTTLEKTYQILHQENIEKEEAVFQKPRKPEHSFHFNDFSIPQTRKINPQKVLLSKTLAFIDMKKFIRYTDKDGGFTVLPISCKSKRLLSMFNSQPQVTYFIDFIIEIGLLAEYDENYQFNAFYSKNNRVKEYVYSYEAECKVKEYCSNNNINKYKVRNYNNSNNSINIRSIDNFDKLSVKFSSKLNLLKPDNWSVHQFEDYLTTCLYDNYPQLQHYQELADLINDVYYSEDVDRQIQFLPTFTWRKGNKCVISIGIRATNCLVSAKKEYEQGDENKNISGYKSEIFERYGLKYHYDVKSSVPRLTYFWNTGIWLDNSVDLYSRMYEKFVHYCPSEKVEWNEKTRKVYKDFHMRGYFDNYSTIAGHIKRLISMKIEYKKDEWTNLDYLMKSYKKSIEETIGETYDSEIFLHESCIYMDVLFELLKRDLEVWQVYDEWNTNEEVEDIYDIISNKAISYYNNYINDNKEYNNNSIKLQDEAIDEPIDVENLAEIALDVANIQNDCTNYKDKIK